MLEDLVYFAIKKENTDKSQSPLTVPGKPDRDRQKLIREQYVLKAVSPIYIYTSTKNISKKCNVM